jgi:hypothetical protein
MVLATVYLVSSDTRVPKIYLLKNIKSFMMSSCMTKLEFLPKPYMMFRIGKLSLIYVACFCIEFCQALLMPYERFVILLKSRSRIHHPHMHYFYTEGRRKTYHSIQIHPKIFYSYTRSEHQKNMFVRFSIH